ncbi:NGG1p interacting factor 3 [Rozella allomycis CSF55]|uniref:NGG1p interacting factor 3 n=1 Tax=Rozella allomycis (strain CSF55) TaxID=988480 RepID=A0A4P9YNF3_ROZAC|nr:NGG1p interacting factor 3 [Rozella allomycis CSF55]
MNENHEYYPGMLTQMASQVDPHEDPFTKLAYQLAQQDLNKENRASSNRRPLSPLNNTSSSAYVLKIDNSKIRREKNYNSPVGTPFRDLKKIDRLENRKTPEKSTAKSNPVNESYYGTPKMGRIESVEKITPSPLSSSSKSKSDLLFEVVTPSIEKLRQDRLKTPSPTPSSSSKQSSSTSFSLGKNKSSKPDFVTSFAVISPSEKTRSGLSLKTSKGTLEIASIMELEKKDLRMIKALEKIKLEKKQQEEQKAKKNRYSHIQSRYKNILNTQNAKTKKENADNTLKTILDKRQSIPDLLESSETNKKLAEIEGKLYENQISKDAWINLKMAEYEKELSNLSLSIMQPRLKKLVESLNKIAPISLADLSWDNVGLLIESPVLVNTGVSKVLVTNDLTLEVCQEAIRKTANFIVTYHPVIFSPMKRIVLGHSACQTITSLCLANNISVFSPHTSLDSVKHGVNDWLIQSALSEDPVLVKPIVPNSENVNQGMGRIAHLHTPQKIKDILQRLKLAVGVKHLRVSVSKNHQIEDEIINGIAVCAGSGGSLFKKIEDGDLEKIDLLITGEMSHHDILSWRFKGKSVILCEHSNSERGFLKNVYAKRIQELLPSDEFTVEYSEDDHEPIQII